MVIVARNTGTEAMSTIKIFVQPLPNGQKRLMFVNVDIDECRWADLTEEGSRLIARQLLEGFEDVDPKPLKKN